MNKKFLSAILFGALMVTSTGTFVSCKDYDDDINRIDNTLNDLKSQIDALQTKVNEGKWITNLTPVTGGFTVTFSDESSYTITNGAQGETGEAGSKVTIDATTGKIIIDGVETEFFAVKNTETGKFAIPTIGEDGFWYIVNKEGKLEATSYKAAPVSAIQDPNTKAWTLKVWNAETKKYDEINLPTAASLITDFEVMGLWNAADKKIETGIKEGATSTSAATVLSVYYSSKITDAQVKAWKGPKTLVKDAYLISSNNNILVRIAPTSLDASGTKFNFVNSKNNSPLGITLNTATKFDGVLARAAGDAGLYTIGVQTSMYKPGQSEDLEKLDGSNVSSTLFALQDISGNFTSPFTLGIAKADASVDVKDIKVNDTKVGVVNSSKYSTVLVNLKEDNTITFDDPAGVYDAYITYSDADKKLFGLTHDNAKMTFATSIMPDIVTKATFDITINYLTVTGEAKTRDIEVKVNSTLSETVYEKSHRLIADKESKNPNYFAIDLKTMKDNMGETNYAIFTKNVDLSKTTYVYTHLDADGETVTDIDALTATAKNEGITEYIVKENKADSETGATTVGDANFIKFAIKNATAANNFALNTEYTVTVTFKDKANEPLTTIKVKFTLTVPALTELLTIEDAVYNKDAKSLFAYMTEGAAIDGETALKAPMYTFKNGFTSTYAETVNDNAIVFEVDQKTEYAKDKKVSSVAEVKGDKDAQYIVLNKADKVYPVYAKDVNVHIKSAKYLKVWEYTIDEEKGEWYSFNIRLMSPITCDAASIEPADGVSIKIPATAQDGTKVSSEDFVAKTYNKVQYDIFQNWINASSKWKNDYIYKVQFKSTNTNVFDVTGKAAADDKGYVEASDATADSNKVKNNGYVIVTPKQIENETTKPMEVVLTDIWGFTKLANVDVTIQRNK